MTFDQHTEVIIKKVNQRTQMLWKMRNHINEDLAGYLYTTLIHPLFTYCDFVYDRTFEYNKNRLQVSQNNAVRAVKNAIWIIPPNNYMIHLPFDDLKTYREKSTLKIVHRGLHNQGLSSLNEMFEFYEPTRSLRSENKCMILPPKSHTKFVIMIYK